MYGFCSDGSRPKPDVGVAPTTFSKGDETNATIVAKNTITAPITAVTQGINSRFRLRFW